MEQLPLAALVANIMAGGWLALQGTISIGTFVAFATYVTTLSQVTKNAVWHGHSRTNRH